MVSAEEVLRESDVVSLLLPSLKETHHFNLNRGLNRLFSEKS
jgi:phosphoglycerate dehydrogenase-like enzyme